MVENKNNTIVFFGDNNEKVEFEIIEQTTINGDNYLLVCDNTDSDESTAFILKEKSINNDEVVYDEVVDDVELQVVMKVFEELIDENIDIQLD